MSEEEQDDPSRRMMFAYLAGLITGEKREELKAMYKKAHKEHRSRMGNCAICETEFCMKMLEPSPFMKRLMHGVKKTNTFRGDMK